MGNIIVKSLSLSLLKEMGLSQFNLFDIRSTQAFLSAQLQGSFHAKDENDIIEYLRRAFISYLCGFVLILKRWINRFLDKRDERQAAKELKGGEE